MSSEARHGRWVRGILMGAPLFIAAGLVAGAGYEQIAEARLAHKHHFRGGLYDVGGHKMHLDCIGEGQPTIVFDSGLGGNSDVWNQVQTDAGKITRACSFDRAGFGWSDSGPLPRDARSETADLHALLSKAGERGSIVLVGHSLGGWNSQLYALEFPNEVAGLVLVDSGHPEQGERLPPSPWDRGVLERVTRMRRLAPFGIARQLGACVDDNDAPIAHCGRYLDTVGAEFASLSTSAHQVRDAYGRSLHPDSGSRPPFGDKPLIVLTRDPAWGDYDPENLKAAWQALQKELAQLSRNSRQEIATGSGHYIQLSRPNLVTTAIRDVLFAARNGNELQGADQKDPN